MTKEKLTLQEHLEIARDLRKAAKLIEDSFYRLQKYFPKSSRTMKSLWRLMPKIDSPWSIVKSDLDTHYHNTISDKEFKEHGHIYYQDSIQKDS